MESRKEYNQQRRGNKLKSQDNGCASVLQSYEFTFSSLWRTQEGLNLEEKGRIWKI